MNRLSYSARPISTIAALAADLGVPERKLRYIARNSQRLYRLAGKKKKSDGTFREIFEARPPLKEVQKQICARIFSRVSYPSYLTGGLRGQSTVTNAGPHVGARILILEDFSSFFPSITDTHVLNVWKSVFRFSGEVAEMLTSLTTRHGVLPQGASTSSYLANCVLGKTEEELVEQFRLKGLAYTRYIDDISVSAKRKLNKSEIQRVIESLWRLASRNRFRLKRGPKHQIRGRGSRLEVTGLIINKRISLPEEYAGKVRAQTQRLESVSKLGLATQTELNSAVGKAQYLQRFRPAKASHLKWRLKNINVKG